MRKSAWLVVLLLLSACSVPFLSSPAAPTQELVVPTMAMLPLDTVETAVAVTPVTDEAMPVADEAMPVGDALCQGELEACQAAATQMAATIVAYEAFGGAEAITESTGGAATATPDMSGGMPLLTPTPDAQAGVPALMPTTDAQSAGMPTATLEAVPAEPGEGVRYRAEAVVYKKNFAHPDKGCNWMGVAGQVLDVNGLPVKNIVVVAEGVLQGADILQVDITGVHGAYGPAGYEIELGSAVISTTNMVYVTLYDLDGTKLSSPVPIATRADCNQNLLILNFEQQ